MRTRLIVLSLLLICIPFLTPFFRAGFFETDDGLWAIVRQASMHSELRQGQFPVRWSGNLNYGYGYPLFQFSYPGPYYIGEVFHLLGLSFVDTIKALFVSATIASVIMMYVFARNLWKSDIAGIIAALLYLSAPYRFVNLYVRGSVGETIAFVLFPLLCFIGLKLLLAGRRRYVFWGSLALALLITMHNVMALIFIPFFIYFLIVETFLRNVKIGKLVNEYIDTFKNKKNSYKQGYTINLFYKHLTPLICMVILGIALSASFWLPAITELQYVRLGTQSLTNIESEFSKQKGLLLTPLDSHPSPTGVRRETFEENLEFEYILLAFASIGVLLFYRHKYELALQRLLLYIIPLLIGLVLLTPISVQLWKTLPGLKSIDFPWRLLGLLSFISPVLIASTALIPRIRLVGLGAAVVSLFLAFPLVSAHGYQNNPDSYYETNQGTTTSANEYISQWMKMPPTSHSLEKIHVVDSLNAASFNYKSIIDKSTDKIYSYTATAAADVLFPIMYFPGWNMTLDGNKKDFEYANSNGIIKTTLPEGKHTVRLVFRRSAPRIMGDLITVGSILGIGILCTIDYARGKKFIL